MMEASVHGAIGALSIRASLSIGAETLVLIGRNGAGKSTVLRMLLGDVAVARGRITVGDRALFDSDAKVNVPIERRRVGYVPQQYALFSMMSVRDNVRFAMDAARSSGVALGASLDHWIEQFALGPLQHRRPNTLSGGEQQRVALARALAVEPQLLLLDEPLAALDVHRRQEVRALLREWLQRVKIPTVLVTHEPDDVRVLGDRVAVMENGVIERACTRDELLSTSDDPFVRALLSAR